MCNLVYVLRITNGTFTVTVCFEEIKIEFIIEMMEVGHRE